MRKTTEGMERRARMLCLEKMAARTCSLMMWALIAASFPLAIGYPSPVAAETCVGDCNGDGSVTVDEIVTMVNIALGTASIDTCPAADPSGDGQVTVDEILQAVNNALNGCPPPGECTTATVTVMLDLEPGVFPAGVGVEVAYPVAVVSIPGSLDDAEVAARVTDVSGVPGFFAVADLDTNEDQVDDRLRTSAVATPSTYSPDVFEEIQFDCEPGASVPSPEDFTCAITGPTDEFGNPIDAGQVGCSVSVATP